MRLRACRDQVLVHCDGLSSKRWLLAELLEAESPSISTWAEEMHTWPFIHNGVA